ncbi:SWIM zinc finger domain-containing protein [bacterium]|nr:SWIM zinc finger domain-containing protein [bacterium]
MPKRKSPPPRFETLTWQDLDDWAGSRIAGRGRRYQRQGRVSDLAATDTGVLVANVAGTKPYVTRVAVDEDGRPESICSCPYAITCKHGVAVVLEYLESVEQKRAVPTADEEDERLHVSAGVDPANEFGFDDVPPPADTAKEIDALLKGRTKSQFVDLLHEIMTTYPEVARDLSERAWLAAGNAEALATSLRREIRSVGDDVGWQDDWRDEGHTPDYSGIRRKLQALLEAGQADEMLALAEELLDTGTDQVGHSHDDGETAMEIAGCMPVIVRALGKSSLDTQGRLAWAVGMVLRDEYDLCEELAAYLHRRHAKQAWHDLADQLLALFADWKPDQAAGEFCRDYERDRFSNWIIHALERAGRAEDALALCESEADRTGSFVRLVDRLMAARRYEDAERWIRKGVLATESDRPGIASSLRDKWRDIRARSKDWPAVAAVSVAEFVRFPSTRAFTECERTAAKAKVWPEVRTLLLAHLKTGVQPWQGKGWPLPAPTFEVPAPRRRERFPDHDTLIQIAIHEKQPDQVLHWYDQRPRSRFMGFGIDEDTIARAVVDHAPERAVALWQHKSERLIAQTKPKAYQEASRYLRRAAEVMVKDKKRAEWERYLGGLREKHHRKRRLLEVLDGMDGEPILKSRR